MWETVAATLTKYEFIAIWLEGIALVAIFLLDWWEYRKQGADRIEQHKESVEQMEIMQSHANATRDSAIAAKDGAEAAKANAEAARLNAEAAKEMLELIISKERARIRVEITALKLALREALAHTVEYTIRLYGSTEARITESGAEAYVSDSAGPRTIKDSFLLPISLPQVITPDVRTISVMAFLYPKLKLDNADVDSINERKSFVHFHGFIKYKDVFERERETKFQYTWTVTDLPSLDAERYSYWTKCGAESDNIET